MKAKHLIRENFRNEVFKRDGFKCRVCKKEGELDAHHITDRNEMPMGGYILENGISLCSECHLKAEQHHIDPTREEDGFSPAWLYQLIDSSFSQAYLKEFIKLKNYRMLV